MLYLSARAIRSGAGHDAAVEGVDDSRNADAAAGIRFQVGQMRERGIVVAVRDGDPTVVVVTDRHLAMVMADVERDLPLYGGHFVGFAGDYAWLANGMRRVRLLREDGTEIGRRDGPMSDARSTPSSARTAAAATPR